METWGLGMDRAVFALSITKLCCDVAEGLEGNLSCRDGISQVLPVETQGRQQLASMAHSHSELQLWQLPLPTLSPSALLRHRHSSANPKRLQTSLGSKYYDTGACLAQPHSASPTDVLSLLCPVLSVSASVVTTLSCEKLWNS